jgi:hypothetical protein
MRIVSDGVILGSSEKAHKVPAGFIVMANGYDFSTWLHTLDVIGRNGRKIHEV